MNKQTAQEKINEISKYEAQTIKKIKIHYLNQQKEINQEEQIVDNIQYSIDNRMKTIQNQKESIKEMDKQIQMKIQKLGDFTQLSSFIQTIGQIYGQFVMENYEQNNRDNVLRDLNSEQDSYRNGNKESESQDFSEMKLKGSQSLMASRNSINPQSNYKVFFQKVNIIKKFYNSYEQIDPVIDKVIHLHQNLASSKQSYQNVNQEISTKIMELQKILEKEDQELERVIEQSEWSQKLQKYNEFSRMSVGQINDQIEDMMVYNSKMNEKYYNKYGYLQSVLLFMFEKTMTLMEILKNNSHLCAHVNQDGKLSELNDKVVEHFQQQMIFKQQLQYLQKQEDEMKFNAVMMMLKEKKIMKSLARRRKVVDDWMDCKSDKDQKSDLENDQSQDDVNPLMKRGVYNQLVEQTNESEINMKIIQALNNNKLFKQYCDDDSVLEYLCGLQQNKSGVEILENIDQHIYQMVDMKVKDVMNIIEHQLIFYKELMLIVKQYKDKLNVDSNVYSSGDNVAKFKRMERRNMSCQFVGKVKISDINKCKLMNKVSNRVANKIMKQMKREEYMNDNSDMVRLSVGNEKVEEEVEIKQIGKQQQQQEERMFVEEVVGIYRDYNESKKQMIGIQKYGNRMGLNQIDSKMFRYEIDSYKNISIRQLREKHHIVKQNMYDKYVNTQQKSKVTLNPIKYSRKLEKLELKGKQSKSQENFRKSERKSQELEKKEKKEKVRSNSQQRLSEQQMEKIRNKYMFNTMKDKYDIQINKRYRKDQIKKSYSVGLKV